MKPEEKAIELVMKYAEYTSDWTNLTMPGKRPTGQYDQGMGIARAIQCAIITVGELIRCCPAVTGTDHAQKEAEQYSEFWTEVLGEIKRMNELHLEANLYVSITT